MGVMPEQSIVRTVDYAVSRGAGRFAALIPNGEYGRRAEVALTQRVSGRGGQLVATERYDRGNTSIVSAAERLRARGGFDTVLIPDGVRLSAMAAGSLKTAGTDLPRLLGTELWSGDDDLTRASALRGAWFSAVSDTRYRQFVTSGTSAGRARASTGVTSSRSSGPRISLLPSAIARCAALPAPVAVS